MQLYAVHAANRVYVCRDLNNVPPVSMKNIDPVMIYRQTVDCRAEVESLKKAHEQQLHALMDAMKKAHEQQLATLMDAIIQLREDIGKLTQSPANGYVSSGPPTTFRDKLLAGKTPAPSASSNKATLTPTPTFTSTPKPNTTLPPSPPKAANASETLGASAAATSSEATGGVRVKSPSRSIPPSASMGLRQQRGVGSTTISHFEPSSPPFGSTKGKGWTRDEEGFWSRDKSERRREPQQQRPTIGTGTRRKLRVVPVMRHDIFVSCILTPTSLTSRSLSVTSSAMLM